MKQNPIPTGVGFFCMFDTCRWYTFSMKPRIIIETTVAAPVAKAWEYWTNPSHITKWAFASDDWVAPHAENDLSVGGKFVTRMESRDGAHGFDFGGTYTVVEPLRRIEYVIDDGRNVSVEFLPEGKGTKIVESFEAESENPEDMQRAGWQAILENYRKLVESN